MLQELTEARDGNGNLSSQEDDLTEYFSIVDVPSKLWTGV
jgi:hypothetical protein